MKTLDETIAFIKSYGTENNLQPKTIEGYIDAVKKIADENGNINDFYFYELHMAMAESSAAREHIKGNLEAIRKMREERGR